MKHRTIGVWACAALLVAAAGSASAQELEIRVIVQNASVRAEASVSSQVLSPVPLGSVLKVVNRKLPWYEVKVKTRMGVEVSGFIHQMYVEEIGAEKPAAAAEPEKKIEPERPRVETPPAAAPRRPSPPAQPDETRPAVPKFGLSLMGGITSGESLSSSSAYAENWSNTMLKSVDERGSIGHSLDAPAGFGVALRYLIAGGLGIQLRADVNGKGRIGNAVSSYVQTWSWTTGQGPFDEDGEWEVGGNQSMTALSLNLLYQLQGAMVQPYVGAGVTYFSGNARIDTRRGYGLTYFSDDNLWQYIDYVVLPVELDADLSGIGFNVGGGLDLMVTRSLGLGVSAAYFLKSPVIQAWTVPAGSYALVSESNISLKLSAEDAAEIAAQIDEVEINPSFFKIQGGIIFAFRP